MKEISIEGVRFMQFTSLGETHWITQKPFDMHKIAGRDNRSRLVELLELEYEVIFPDQNHTANINIVNHSNLHKSFSDCDALITNVKDLPIGVVTADCVPVLLEDKVKGVVAAVHAGWRGTVQNIVGKTVKIMTTEFGCRPENIFAGIGPSISPMVYEVGEDVYQSFIDNDCPNDLLFSGQVESGKYLLDLWKANIWQLLKNRVPHRNVENSKKCTFTEDKKFYSARRDTINTGRLAAIIKM